MKHIVSFIAILALSIGSFFAFFSPKNSEEVAYADTYNVLPYVFVNVSDDSLSSHPHFLIRFNSSLSAFASGSYSINGYDIDASFGYSPYVASYQFVRGSWETVVFESYGSRLSTFVCQYFCDENFALDNVAEVGFWGDYGSAPHPANCIRYLDANGYRFQFNFWCYYVENSTDVPGLLYQEEVRTLYTSPVDSNTTTWQVAYQNGYDNGRIAGQESGYTDGYNVGYSAGDAVGYQRGVDASNQYSFGNLLFAVVDTPVVIFRSLFDFNVLGVNLQGFFFSLLTVAVVIAVVRFILAK